jgi:Cytochrome P460
MVGTPRAFMTALAAAAILGAGTAALADTKLPPPKGYRQWFHVNTAIVTKDSPVFGDIGGMHNVYVNASGLKALKSGGLYPDKSVFVSDVHDFTITDGVYSEGGRKGVAIMIKDAGKYAATGGWGFQFWIGGDPAKPVVTDAAKQCFGCHTQQKDHQFVFSTYLP